MAKATNRVPDGYHTVTPMLTLDDTSAAIAWYHKALGAEELSRSVGPDGKVMHAEIRIGDARVMLHDAMMGAKGPRDMGGSPASLWLYVNDCDALFERAVAAGAEIALPISDAFWGDRCGAVRDLFGYRWTIATRIEDLTGEEIERRQRAWLGEQAAQGVAQQ